MGKREGRKKNEDKFQEYGAEFSTITFCAIWDHLSKLCRPKQQFALHWILKNEEVFVLFVTHILKIDVSHFCRAKFLNGYNNCKIGNPPVLSLETCQEIDKVFHHHRDRLNLPPMLRKILLKFYDLNLQQLRIMLGERVESCKIDNTFSSTEVEVKQIPKSCLQKLTGVIVGNWDESMTRVFACHPTFVFKRCPSDFLVIEKSQNIVYFYDRSGKKPWLIAMLMHQNILSSRTLRFIRALLSTLFVAHLPFQRGEGKKAFDSSMTGYGPWNNSYIGGRVAFYTHKEKMATILDDCPNVEGFENLIDKYSHVELVDIILGLYMWWCPKMLESFLEYSHPYLLTTDHGRCHQKESQLGTKVRPSAYQLYISKDYCAQAHVDDDATDFTLAYASHPDYSAIDFVIVEYGIRLPVKDGSLFAFRGDVVHATGFRIKTPNPAYVGAITVNKNLGRLVQKLH